MKKYSASPIYISGDGYFVARRALTEAGLKIEHTPALLINESAAAVAAIAYKKLLAKETVTDSDISPKYLRLPQAERERLEKEKKEKEL